MVFDSRSFFIRVLCLFLVVLVLANIFLIPVRAASFLYEILAVAGNSLLSSIIRALGVQVVDDAQDSLNEGLQVWDRLVNYVFARLPDSFKYTIVAGQVGLKLLFKDGIFYVDENLVAYVMQILTEPGIDYSTNEEVVPIGYDFDSMESWMVSELNSILADCVLRERYYYSYIRNLPYCTYVDFQATDPYSVYQDTLIIFSKEVLSNVYVYRSGSAYKLHVEIPSGHSVYLFRGTDSEGNGAYRPHSSNAYTFEIDVSGATVVNYQGDVSVNLDDSFGSAIDSIVSESIPTAIDSTWVSSSTTVTDDRLGGTVTSLPISVPSTSQEAATSTKSEIISGTKVEVETVVVPESVVVPDTESVTNTGILSKILTYVQSIADSLSISSEPPEFDSMILPSLKDFFPFCIPYDLYDMMQVLCADPVAPQFTFATSFLGNVYTVDIDLAQWDDVAQVVRYMIVAIYIVTLAVSTRKFIKW